MNERLTTSTRTRNSSPRSFAQKDASPADPKRSASSSPSRSRFQLIYTARRFLRVRCFLLRLLNRRRPSFCTLSPCNSALFIGAGRPHTEELDEFFAQRSLQKGDLRHFGTKRTKRTKRRPLYLLGHVCRLFSTASENYSLIKYCMLLNGLCPLLARIFAVI